MNGVFKKITDVSMMWSYRKDPFYDDEAAQSGLPGNPFVSQILYSRKRAGIAQLVVLGLAVHSVASSILLWGLFPVEGIFPLELTWVQTPFPQKLLRVRV